MMVRFMKLFSKIALPVLILLIISFSTISAGAVSCELKAQTTGTFINVRSSANLNGSIVTTIAKKNTTVTLLNTDVYNDSWYKIKLSSGKKGYISKDFLKIKSNQLFISAKKTGYEGYKSKITCVNTTNKKITWKSSDTKVAKISSDGVITALKEGTAVITAKAGTKTSKSNLTVKKATVTINAAPTEMLIGDTDTIDITCKKAVTYKSSNTKVATVNSNGEITAVSAGVAEITASSKSGSDSCKIKVSKRVLKLTTLKTTLYTGTRSTINATGGENSYKFKSSDKSVLTVDNNGLLTAVGKGSAKITCTSGDLKGTKTFKVVSGSSVNISNKSGTVNAGMTLYVKSSTSNVKWSSSNTEVATVNKDGFILGVSEGIAVISASTSSGSNDCLVTVDRAEAVRFVYTSENSSLVGDTVEFYGITDKERNYLKFEVIDPDGKTSWINDTVKSVSENRHVFTGKMELNKAGEYQFKAYSKTSKDAEWLTAVSAQGTTFATKVSSKWTVAYGERRASSDLIDIIAAHEGYFGSYYIDTLANNIPTVGYGRVIYAGSTFYNSMIEREAYAFLVKTINESGYTSRMNKILIDNKIKFNQHQFDALVDFSYNLGPYCITNNSSLYNVLLNTYGKSSNEKKAFANCFNAVIRKSTSESSKSLKKLSPGAEITLSGASGDWYKVKIDSSTTGYIKKSQVTRRTTDTSVRNLNNVNMNTFAKAYLPYHHAGGTCYKGLLYRRVDEVEIFFLGDYKRDGKDNKAGLSYKCSNNSGFYI